MLVAVFATFAFVGWLNVVWGVRMLTQRRRAVESMDAKE